MGEVVFFTHYSSGENKFFTISNDKFFTISNDKYNLDKQLLELLTNRTELEKQNIVSDGFVMKSKTESVGFYFDEEGNCKVDGKFELLTNGTELERQYIVSDGFVMNPKQSQLDFTLIKKEIGEKISKK